MSQSSKPTPIAIPNEMLSRIEYAAKQLGMSKSEVMRMTMAVGLEHFARINYNLAGAILDAATPKPSAPTVKPGQTKTAPPPAASPSNITPLPPQHLDRAAEDGSADESPPAQKVSYGSGNGRRKKT